MVWRLSKSAFLCGGFGRRTFYFGRGIMKEKLIYKAKYPRIENTKQDEKEQENVESDPAPKEYAIAIRANTQYTPIPKRAKESEIFINEAIAVSKLYQIDARIAQREGRICVRLAFDFGVDMQYVTRLFGMADRVSFFKDKSEHDLAVCLDFYTHVVVRNGLAIAP